MIIRHRTQRGLGTLAATTALAATCLIIAAGPAWAQTPVKPDELAALQKLAAAARAAGWDAEAPFVGELRAAPSGTATLDDYPALRGRVDLYRGPAPLNTGATYADPLPTIGTGKAVAELASQFGGRVAECEFAFGVRAETDNDTVQPYVVVSFYKVPAGVVEPTAAPLTPASSLAYRFDPLELPSAGAYIVRSGLIDLAAKGMDFDLDGTFLVEILPLAWSGTEAVSTPNVFAVAWPTPGAPDRDAAKSASHADEPGIVLCGLEQRDVNQLKLAVDPENFGTCVQPGNPVQVTLSQAHLNQPVQGYRAYVKFDRSRLEFQSGQYLAEPYGCPPVPVVTPVFGETEGDQEWWYITLEASICAGGDPTQEDAPLAILNFTATTSALEDYTEVVFRDNHAPETLTQFFRYPDGGPVAASRLNEAAVLIDGVPPVLECPPDWTGQCVANAPVGASYMQQIVDQGGQADDGSAWFRTPTVTFEDTEADPQGSGCPGDPWEMDRTYTLVDCAGNESSCTYHFTVVDDTRPVVVCPDGVDVECPEDVPDAVTTPEDFAALPGAYLHDNCTADANLVVTHVGDVSDGHTCPEVITRTYRVTDECGNFAECQQTITVDDKSAPTITCPAPDQVQCPDDVDEAVTDPEAFVLLPGASLGDNCTALVDLVLVHVGDESDGLTCPETITRRYRVIDECGNLAECIQMIVVDDTEEPTIRCPDPVGVQCPTEVPLAVTDPDEFIALPGAFLHDNCTALPNLTVTHMGDESDGQTCPETITRTYRVNDGCGNWAECEQIITVDDTIDPTIDCPDDVSVQCPDDVPPPVTDPDEFDALPGADLNDNCTMLRDLVITHVSDVPDGGSCPRIITRTYRVTDECGNTDECTQEITVDDTIAPTITCPNDISVQCPEGVPAVVTDPDEFDALPGAGLSDNCTLLRDLVVTHVGDESDGLTCPETITRTYRVTDECGNTAECTQTITVDDTIRPSITCPNYEWVQCREDVPPPVTDPTEFVGLPGASLNDNCTSLANLVITHVGDDSDGLTCPETITRTYRVTDECGNWDECTQEIVVDDTIAPTVTCPDLVPVQCPSDVPDPVDTPEEFDALPGANAEDNCTLLSQLTLTHMGDVSDSETCPMTITRTYRFTDACGNWIECEQTITVDDTTPPEVTSPDDTTVQCPEDVPDPVETPEELVALPGALLSDNCTALADLVLVHLSDLSDGQTCPETITRTYRFIDECGNPSDCEHTIVVNDTINPTIDCPDNVSVQCPGDIPSVVTDSSQFVLLAGAALDDNCTSIENLVITHVGDASDGLACPGTITRTYRVTDECGNWNECEQIITVDDTIDPEGTQPPDAGSYQCLENIPAAATNGAELVAQGGTASDNCTALEDLIVTSVDTPLTDPCGGTVERTYTIADECGNSFELPPQTFGVNDTTDPSMVWCPNVTRNNDAGVCGAEVLLNAFASDNCDGDLLITYWIESDPGVFDQFISNPYFFPVSVTQVEAEARDACYNFSERCSFTVTVNDNEAPHWDESAHEPPSCAPPEANWIEWPQGSGEFHWVIVGAPDDSSGGQVNWTGPMPIDNCDANPEMTCNPPSGSFFPLGVLTEVSCTATDDIGNTSGPCTFYVVVQDDAPCICCPGQDPCDCQGAYSEPPDCETPLPPVPETYSNDPGECSASIELNACARDDLPGVAISFWIESNPQYHPGVFDQPIVSGYDFPIGETAVRALATDTSGQVDDCIFSVTVVDDEPPEVMDCPEDIIVNPDEPTGCSAWVEWSAPSMVADNCGYVRRHAAGHYVAVRV